MAGPTPTGFTVEPSPSVREVLIRNNLLLEPDRVALDAMAAQFGQKTPKQPRAVLIYDDEMVHTPEATILVPADDTLRRLHAPTVQPGDYLVRLPVRFELKTEDITLALATIFRRRQREDERVNLTRAGFGSCAGGVALICGGEFGLHNNWVKGAGAGFFVGGAARVAYAANRDPIGKMPDISQLSHPLRVLPRGPERDAIGDKTVIV